MHTTKWFCTTINNITKWFCTTINNTTKWFCTTINDINGDEDEHRRLVHHIIKEQILNIMNIEITIFEWY